MERVQYCFSFDGQIIKMVRFYCKLKRFTPIIQPVDKDLRLLTITTSVRTSDSKAKYLERYDFFKNYHRFCFTAIAWYRVQLSVVPH